MTKVRVRIPWNWDLFSKNPNNWEVYNRRGVKITFINHDPERTSHSKVLYDYYDDYGDVMRRIVGYDGKYNSDCIKNEYDLTYMVMIKNDTLDDEEELTIPKRLMFAVFLNTETNLLSCYRLTNCENPQEIEEAVKLFIEGASTKVHLATINLEDHPQVKVALKAQGLTRKKN
jgi:hypothetical protein